MCMTWEASDGSKKRNVIHLCGGKAHKKESDEGRKEQTEKLYKKWQELMLMVLYKYYF